MNSAGAVDVSQRAIENPDDGQFSVGPLDELVIRALRAPDIEDLLFSNRGFFPAFMARLKDTLERAFGRGEEQARREAHHALFSLYEENFDHAGKTGAANQFHPFIMRARSEIERAWERFERDRLDLPLDSIPVDGEEFSAYYLAYCSGHRLANHPLFDFLAHGATRADIVRFFASDSALVLRFCDLITLSMVGADDEIRDVLAGNFWDEMGQGNPARRHTMLFKRLLSYVGAERPAAEHLSPGCPWQRMAGFNLYMFLSLNRRNYFMSLGCLGSGEIMDPSQYLKIIEGCRRVGFTDREALAYYLGHAELDVQHGAEWLTRVLVPLVRKYPQARRDIMLGAGLRLNITADYYDFLLRDLGGTDRA